MHSRVGLATEFLGPEWFDCVRATIDECKKLGMEAWLYDEDRWPSGAAGGFVTKNKKYRMRSLTVRVLNKLPKKNKNLLRVFRGTFKKHKFQPDARGKHFLAFSVELQQPSSWYNDQTYPDTMSKEAIGEFIRQGYEPYAREVGGEFGKSVPGIFTDEPNYGRFNRDAVPWTDSLPREFKKRYGYNILDWLPAVFFEMNEPESVAARYHYHDITTALFVENFAGQIGR